MNGFSPKAVAADQIVSFDFLSLLALGETITGYTVDVDVFSGTDANPENLLSGAPTADGAVVSQLVTGGIAGITYIIVCSATTSNSQTLQMQGLLSVVSNNPF